MVIVEVIQDTVKHKHPGGRPPIYKTPEDMETLVNKYFDETKTPAIFKTGVEYIPGPFTMTGLAIALGFTSRQALWNYEGKSEFFDVIARARARVIEYAEGRLYDKEGSNGAKFALGNFNDGWSDKTEVTNTNVNITIGPDDAAQLLSGIAGYYQAVERNVTPEVLAIPDAIPDSQ